MYKAPELLQYEHEAKYLEENLSKLSYDYKHIATNFNIRIRVCDHCTLSHDNIAQRGRYKLKGQIIVFVPRMFLLW